MSIISRSVQFLLGSRRSLSFKRHEILSLLVSNHYRRGLQLYSTRRKSSNANGGTVSKVESGEKIEKMNPVKEREITVRY